MHSVKMKIFKLTIALGLVAGSAVFSFMIFQEHRNPIVDNSLPKTNSTTKTEPLSGSLDFAKNSTQEVAKIIAEEIIKQNPDGPVTADGIAAINAIAPEELAGKVLNEQMESLDLSSFSPEVNFSAIKITAAIDKTSSENYLKNFRAILNNNFGHLGVDFSSPTVRDFEILARAYKKTVAEFYTLLVPQKLAVIHSEQIRLMLIQTAIFETLAGFEQDPLKALVAIQLSKEVDNRLEELKKQLGSFIADNNLTI